MTRPARTALRRLRSLTGCLLWLAASPLAAAPPLPEPLTLQDALLMAGDSHPLMAASRAQLEGVEASAAQTFAEDDVDIGAILEGRVIQPSDYALDKSHNDSTASLYARKRLYDFGRTDAREAAAESSVTGGKLRFTADMTRYRINIMQAFFSVLLADLEYARDNEAMAVAYVEADRLRDRNELGQTSDVQLLEQENTYQELRMQRLRSQASQRSSRARLAQLLDHPDDLPATLAAPDLAANDRPLPEYDYLVAAALAHNPRVLSLKADLEAARLRIKAERAGSRPVLSGSVSSMASHRDLSSRNPFEAELRLDIPLYRGDRVDAGVARAQADMHSVAASLQQLEYDLRQDLLDLWLNIQTLLAQREQVKVSHDYRSLDFDRAQALYELQVKTDFGESLVGQSKAALLAARTEYALALDWARLSALTGQPYSPYLQLPSPASTEAPASTGNPHAETLDR